MAYNPSMYMPQPMAAPIAPPNVQQNWMYQPTQSTAQPVNGLVSVTGIEGARAYQLPPNSQMPLFDGNQDLLYVKSTDAAGYPTIRTFRFEPMEIEAKVVEADYVQRSEFDELVAQVKALLDQPKQTRTRKAATDGE